MARRQETRSQAPLIGALQSLGDGITSLVSNHLKLAQLEIKQDAAEAGKDVAALVAAVGLAAIGYVLLNLSAILFAAWHGIVAAALVTAALALIHLVGGALAVVGTATKVRERYYGFYTSHEIDRSKKWASKETHEPERLKATIEPSDEAPN